MQILFLLIGLIGLVLFFLGVKMLVEKYRNKIIGELKLTENELNFEQTGLYAICIVGGNYATNLGKFEVKITSNGIELDTFEKQLKFKFYHKNRLATEFYQFEVLHTGIHKIIIKNIEDLVVKESMLVSKRLFQKKLPIEKIGIIVKETLSSANFIVILLMVVLGINIAVWGIILAFNPHLIK